MRGEGEGAPQRAQREQRKREKDGKKGAVHRASTAVPPAVPATAARRVAWGALDGHHSRQVSHLASVVVAGRSEVGADAVSGTGCGVGAVRSRGRWPDTRDGRAGSTAYSTYPARSCNFCLWAPVSGRSRRAMHHCRPSRLAECRRGRPDARGARRNDQDRGGFAQGQVHGRTLPAERGRPTSFTPLLTPTPVRPRNPEMVRGGETRSAADGRI